MMEWENDMRKRAAALWDLLAETATTESERECARLSADTYRWSVDYPRHRRFRW